VTAALERVPFDDDTFDLVWCAQSLCSLPDPFESVRMLRRVVRPGGTLAVLENDTPHHVLLPWSVEGELAVQEAECRPSATTSSSARSRPAGDDPAGPGSSTPGSGGIVIRGVREQRDHADPLDAVP
jgi:SAM-dependent methyltransferase